MEEQPSVRDIAVKACREVLQQRFEELAEEVSRRVETVVTSLIPPPRPEPIQELRDGVAFIAASRTQTETLDTLLAAASSITPKCGLMILRGTQAGGWSCKGLGSPESFKRVTLDCSQGVAAKVISSVTPAEATAFELDPVFVSKLGLEPEERVLLLPVLLKERVAAVLVALGRETEDLPGLELLLQVAHLAIDLQVYRKSPPPEPVRAAEPAPPPVEPARVAEPTLPPVEQPKVEAYEAPAEAAPVALEPPAQEPVPEAEPVVEPVVETKPEKPAVSVPPPPVPAATAAGASVAPSPSLPVPRPAAALPRSAPPSIAPPPRSIARPPMPPRPPARPAGPAAAAAAPAPQPAISSEIQEKAARFARLLVDEIKLYNQAKVSEGRLRCDLYSRLREDIEKSRAAYSKRYGEHVKGTDYFTQELLRILADNKHELMGADFPG